MNKERPLTQRISSISGIGFFGLMTLHTESTEAQIRIAAPAPILAPASDSCIRYLGTFLAK
jgi:hypothetical protein